MKSHKNPFATYFKLISLIRRRYSVYLCGVNGSFMFGSRLGEQNNVVYFSVLYSVQCD